MRTISFSILLSPLFLSSTLANGSEAAKIELIGAIAKGSDDGSVPAWTGGLNQDLPLNNGHHIDPFKDEKPLFIIDINNYQKHKKRLTPGLIALLETYPESFNIPVYPSHRTTTYPDWFFENTRNAQSAKLNDSNIGFDSYIKGINFPNPQNGLEAISNHLTRWRGRYFTRNMAEATVFENGSNKLIKSYQEVAFEAFRNINEPKDDNQILVNYSSYITYPPKLAGGALLLIDYLNPYENPRKAWAYDIQQRRIKRLPDVNYDNSALLSDGLRSADETDMFNGATDRFEWNLIGREIKYIPYNNYQLSSPDVKYDQLLTPYHFDPQYTRFEAHRVWIVEATLKEDNYHIYKKRRFYLDEDSWGIAIADQYDHKDQVWRVSLAFMKQYYEVPLQFTAVAVFHDLQKKQYNVHGMTNEEDGSGKYYDELPDLSYFRPATLKRRMRR